MIKYKLPAPKALRVALLILNSVRLAATLHYLINSSQGQTHDLN